MHKSIRTFVSFREYQDLMDLGRKLNKIPKLTSYQVAAQFALQMYYTIAEHFEDGWNFWYTNQNTTIEAFRIIHPVAFQFVKKNSWTSIILGLFEETNTRYFIYALNYLAEAERMIGAGYRLRRSKERVFEDVTELFGLDVYAPKRTAKIIALR